MIPRMIWPFHVRRMGISRPRISAPCNSRYAPELRKVESIFTTSPFIPVASCEPLVTGVSFPLAMPFSFHSRGVHACAGGMLSTISPVFSTWSLSFAKMVFTVDSMTLWSSSLVPWKSHCRSTSWHIMPISAASF